MQTALQNDGMIVSLTALHTAACPAEFCCCRIDITADGQVDLRHFGKSSRDLVIGPDLRVVLREKEVLAHLRLQIYRTKEHQCHKRSDGEAHQHRNIEE
jgi:hypothetical protein